MSTEWAKLCNLLKASFLQCVSWEQLEVVSATTAYIFVFVKNICSVFLYLLNAKWPRHMSRCESLAHKQMFFVCDFAFSVFLYFFKANFFLLCLTGAGVSCYRTSRSLACGDHLSNGNAINTTNQILYCFALLGSTV